MAPSAPAASPLATASGAHDLYKTNGITCAQCHPCGVKDPSGHAITWMDQASAIFHASSANQNLAGCTSCHGSALDGVGGTINVSCASCHGVTWKTNCTECHGDRTLTATSASPLNAAPFAVAQNTWGNKSDAVRVGTHEAHLKATHGLSAAVACSSCHTVPTDAQSAGHANGSTADVTFSGMAVQGSSPTWTRTGATCSNTYCHGATLGGGTVKNPVWTTTDGTARACTACHGAPPPAPHTTSTACGSCHTGYTATTVNAATHINGTLDVTGASCNTCHGSATNNAPPTGTKGETATTTVAVGAHQAHLTGTALRTTPIACTECHVVPNSTSHANSVVDVNWGTLAVTGSAAPTWTKASATCSGTYCHGATLNAGGTLTAPVWTKVDGTQVACGTCHGAPPPAPHTTSTACGSCHTGYTSTSVNKATHLNGTLDVVALSCTSCHGTATAGNAAPPVGTKGETATTTRAVGAHQAHLVNTNLRSAAIACTECHPNTTSTTHSDGTIQMTWGSLATFGSFTPTWTGATCTNYCHGSSLAAGGSNTAPTWTGGATQAACGTCHGNPPTTGGHTTSTACGSCHTGYTNTSVNKAVHINGTLDVVALTCTSCHGTATAAAAIAAAPPAGTKGETATTTRAVGAHQAHLVNTNLRSAAIACTECHTVPTSTTHSSGAVEMSWGTLATDTNTVTPTWNTTNLTCTNYCHGTGLTLAGGSNKNPVWTSGATQAACGTCHGVPPGGTHTTSTACSSCHGTGYDLTGITGAAKTTHINGTVESTSYHPAGWSAGNVHGSGASGANMTGLAGCKTCHGANLDGVGGSTTVSCTACHTNVGFANWATNCTFCHGVQSSAGTGIQYPPVDTKGSSVATNVSVGRHASHMTSTMMTAMTCVTCHPARSTSVITDAAHIDGDGIAEVSMATIGGAAPTYTRTSATAATCTTWCHSSFSGSAGTRAAISKSWVATTTGSCTTCHASAPATGRHPPGTSKHNSVTCTNCHGTGYTATAVTGTAVATHINGTKNVGGTGSSITTWNATTKSCTPTCHSAKTW